VNLHSVLGLMKKRALAAPAAACCRLASARTLPPRLNDCFWPILLKKSAMVSAAEKYASEIEIFTFGRAFQTQISRSSV
jgi:hypothetical protein